LVIGAHGEGEIDPAFATLVKQGAGAVLISSDALFTGCRDQIVVLAARHALPTIYTLREYAMAGGFLECWFSSRAVCAGRQGRMLLNISRCRDR